jgi:tetratricopeptide (TPR) repeat protein
MSSQRPRSSRWIEGLLLILLCATAAAAPSEYNRAVMLYQAGQYEDAIEAFREAYRQKPQALIMFNIAQAFRKDGKPASALEHYQRFLAEVKPGEEPGSQENAKKYIAEIEKQLSLAPKPVEEPPPSPVPQVLVVPPPARPPPPPILPPEPPKQPEKVPVYKKWWLWTAVAGVAVVAIAVGVGVGVGTKSNDPSTALGTRQPVF